MENEPKGLRFFRVVEKEMYNTYIKQTKNGANVITFHLK